MEPEETPSDEERRKEARRAYNRQNAQRSRQRTKSKITGLMAEIDRLEKESVVMCERQRQLQREATLLRQENEVLRRAASRVPLPLPAAIVAAPQPASSSTAAATTPATIQIPAASLPMPAAAIPTAGLTVGELLTLLLQPQQSPSRVLSNPVAQPPAVLPTNPPATVNSFPSTSAAIPAQASLSPEARLLRGSLPSQVAQRIQLTTQLPRIGVIQKELPILETLRGMTHPPVVGIRGWQASGPNADATLTRNAQLLDNLIRQRESGLLAAGSGGKTGAAKADKADDTQKDSSLRKE